MPGVQRTILESTARANSHINGTTNGVRDDEEILDAVIIGAGFAGVYILHKLREAGFSAKIIEAGGGLVDSQYPIYAISLPEIYSDWTWSSHYPDHVELRAYFNHIDKKLDISKDTIFNNTVQRATFRESDDTWLLECDTGRKVRARHFVACLGFAAKRYIPDWPGIDDFQGEIHHSSFWPHEGVNVKGKKCGVVGTGATGVQITQEWADDIGEEGSLKMFQRTPNLACPMNQVWLTKEEQEEDKKRYPELFEQRWLNYNGFLYQYRDSLMRDATAEEREAMFDRLWKMGGFRFLMNNYYDMTRELTANRLAYNYWHDRIHEKVNDPRKAELLAPKEPPHPFGAKRLSLEQTFYDQFNKPNVDVIDIKTTPIASFTKTGIVQTDGTHHDLDVIALATGFDAITGGFKDIEIRGLKDTLLSEKWKLGTWTYLGLMTARIPNMYMTYAPQGPTAFSNGPSCNELQGDWIVGLMKYMREKGLTRVDAREEEEKRWKAEVEELASRGVRGHTNSWYNGQNIPGKPKEALNYAGGIPVYIKEIGKEANNGYPGFHLQ